jgi:hypothetical protein
MTSGSESCPAIRTVAALKILTLVLLAWGCGDSKSLTSPSPTPSPTPSVEPPVGFLVVAGMNVVRVGDAMPFTATVYRGPPPWAPGPPFDATRKATVSSSGLVTVVGAGTAEISATYKGVSYALPLVAVDRGSSNALSRYVGTWSGVAMITCKVLFGFLKSGCLPNQPDPHPAQLTLMLADDRLTGTLTLYQNPMTGPVQAALLDTSELAVGGSIQSGEGNAIVPLRQWRLTLTRRGQLAGTCFQDLAFVNVYGSVYLRQQSQIDGLAPQ